MSPSIVATCPRTPDGPEPRGTRIAIIGIARDRDRSPLGRSPRYPIRRNRDEAPMPKITTLDEKLAHDLGDIYDAEHRFLEAQREMLNAATDRNLKKMIKSHIAQSEGQIERLDRGFEVLGKKAKRVKCAAAAGLVTEGQKGIEDSEENPKVRDC